MSTIGIIHPPDRPNSYDPKIVDLNLERTTALLPLPTNYNSQKLENSRVVFTGQCRLEGFTALSTLGSTQYIMIFDATTVPADGTVCALTFSVATNTSVGGYWGTTGRWMQFGLVICNSTTVTSKTLGAANCGFDVQYTPVVPYTSHGV